MSPDGAEIRAARAGDENGIIDGLNRSRRAPLSLEDWSWSYPLLAGGRPIVVAVCDGRVVGHIGGVVSAFQLEGRTVPALALADVFTDQTMGGAGERDRLLTNLLESLLTEFGGHDRFQLVYRLAEGGESGEGSSLNGGTGIELPRVEVLVRREAVRAPVRRLAFRAEPARDWEPRLDDLWRRICRSYPFAGVRDAETALLRHAGHPSVRRHRFLVFPRFSRRAAAFAVFEVEGARCRWVDLVWDHDQPGALDLLCHLSRRLANQVGATEERIILGGDADGRARLEKAGFRSKGIFENLSLTAFSLPPGVASVDLELRCYITQADLDPLRRIG